MGAKEDMIEEVYEVEPFHINTIRRILRTVEAKGWLRDPAEPVPGRTITESEVYDHVADDTRMHGAFVQGFVAAGGTVVADPEPTNFDRLKKFMTDVQKDGLSPDSAAEWLDFHGVKAPGDDDD